MEGRKGVAAAAVRGESGVPTCQRVRGRRAAGDLYSSPSRAAGRHRVGALGWVKTPHASSARNGSTLRLLARAKVVCI